ncbi:hypothetical protein BY996DRAFT_6601196 [Phakopsora pachyrhizi]|nr:hypothetical protein BY996DRAFT_6601196 [Phakopsora pachyrhizi]
MEGDHIIGREGYRISEGRTEVSVGLVRQRTDIGGISKAVVGRAVGQDCRAGARRRHTEVRSSYHFRVRTKVNSTTVKKTSKVLVSSQS